MRVRLSAARIANILGATAALSVLMLVGTYLHNALADASPTARWIAQQFTLARENNVAAWFASMLLLAVAFATLVCFVLDRRLSRGPGERLLSYGWLAMAVLFAGLSLDELGSVHERLGELRALEDAPLRVRSMPTWVGLLLVPVLLVCGALIAFAFVKLRRNPLSLWLMAGGFLLFASVPLQEAMETAIRTGGGRRHIALGLLEEGSELVASFLLLASSLWFAHERARASNAGGDFTIPIGLRSVVALQMLLALAMVLVGVVLAGTFEVDNRRGNPLNWFPAALSATVAMIAAYAASRARELRGTGAILWAMAAIHLVLSADHGSAHRFTTQMLAGTPLARWTLDGALGAAILACAGFLIERTNSPAVRALMLGWAVLLLVPLFDGAWRPWSGFAGYMLAIPALLLMLDEEGVQESAVRA